MTELVTSGSVGGMVQQWLSLPGSLEIANADADSFNVLEGNMKRSVHRESADVRRSP